MSDTVLSIRNLYKSYKGFAGIKKFPAIEDLNLELGKGEVYGLLGPNGSGKTTLMKLVIGLLFPTRGQIKVFGHVPSAMEAKERIGYLPEESYLYRFLNAEETLGFYGALAGISSRELPGRIDQVLTVVGLAGVRKKRSRFYSKGMSRRLGLALVLLKDPDLVILDEPTIGLDPLGAREIKDIILDLKKRGKTVIFSSHLLSEVELVADRMGIIHRGRLLVSGTLEELLKKDKEWTFVLDDFDVGRKEELERLMAEKFRCRVTSLGRSRETMENMFIKTLTEAKGRE